MQKRAKPAPREPLSFTKARALARSLGLQSGVAYREHARKLPKPRQLPVLPEQRYASSWKGWADFLGSSYAPKNGWDPNRHLPFANARAQVRALKLTSSTEYHRVRREKALKLPAAPSQYYAKEWKGWPDFLGASYRGHLRGQSRYPSYAHARTIAHGLKLSSGKAYQEWARGQPEPRTMPLSPQQTYKSEWQGFADFLGPSYAPMSRGRPRATIAYPSYKAARRQVRAMGFRYAQDYRAWVQEQPRPRPLPPTPKAVYGAEWKGWADFLGPSYARRQGRVFHWVSFKEARTLARRAGLTTQAEYAAWVRKQPAPRKVPLTPNTVYAREWGNWSDFLGKKKEPASRPALPFAKARRRVRPLKLRSAADYVRWHQEQPKPCGLPRSPAREYADDWKGWADFLGSSYAAGTVARPRRTDAFTIFPGLIKAVPTKVPRARAARR